MTYTNSSDTVSHSAHGGALADPYTDDGSGQAADADVETIDSANGYVSDADLIAWLEWKGRAQNENLADLMDVSTTRTELMQRLNDLKALLDANGHPSDIAQQMQQILDDYKDTPFYGELSETMSGSLAAINAIDDPEVGTMDHEKLKNTQTNLSARLKGELDTLEKNDQLSLIKIQQLMADARETSELASNVLQSRSQTSNSIVGNIRG